MTKEERDKLDKDPKYKPDLNKLYTRKVPLSFEPAAMYVTKDFKIKLENKFKTDSGLGANKDGGILNRKMDKATLANIVND